MNKKEKSKKEHLPLLGVGPLCAFLMAAVLVILIALRGYGILDGGAAPQLRIWFNICGVLLIIFGAVMWVKAALVERIGEDIVNNNLCTTGTYAIVRNPLYSAIAMVLSGIGLLLYNWWFLLLPVFCWLDITLMMKATEEKWLSEMYGEEYTEYCKKVNRCIPWFPGNK